MEGRAVAAEKALDLMTEQEQQAQQQLSESKAECDCLQSHINGLTAILNASVDAARQVCTLSQ